jgi:glutamate/tyrosine decarboxylase-like PLP-dependent enzyme
MRIYASAETHHSVSKAATLLGIGHENVCTIAVDERFRVQTDDLIAQIETDLADGRLPFCVVANAGTVNTGACDPLAEVRAVAIGSGSGCTSMRATAGLQHGAVRARHARWS